MKALALLIILAGLVPTGILGVKIAETWTPHHTDLLIGLSAASCGGFIAILAGFVGVAFFVRLNGTRRETPTAPPTIDGWTAAQQQPMLPPPSNIPPWGVTSSGNYHPLPAPRQSDSRYSYSIEVDGGKRK